MTSRGASIFPYFGGKSKWADWVVDHLPDHTRYVEAFGGAASVLLTKPRSRYEVYNDVDDEVFNFFEVLRDRPEQLQAFLDRVEYGRTRHERWAEEFHDDDVAIDDPVERAGRFFFLQYSSINAKTLYPSGFKTTAAGSPGRTFANKKKRLREFADRFEEVIVENRDYRDVVDLYDGPDTLHYLDPPYVDVAENYREGDFDHAEFVDVVGELEGDVVISYGDLPDALDPAEFHVVERDVEYTSSSEGKRATERLLMNFDPGARASFAGRDQTALGEYV